MQNRLCEMFGIEFPIFAFTHCRDVAAAVSRAGGWVSSARWRSVPTSSNSN